MRPSLPSFITSLAASLAALLPLTACQSWHGVDGAEVVVFGEQHDQLDQQRQVASAVERLAARARLRAVVLEMAERGRSTAALRPDATDADARKALGWQDGAWPWAQYGPVVMAAVRGGVPVWGGNLPRAEMRDAMADASLDDQVPPAVASLLTSAIRTGHCGLLPDAMAPGMLRIQVARDRTMAQVVRDRLAPSGAIRGHVLLLTGAQHASRDRGVPWHLMRHHNVPRSAIRVVMFDPGSDSLIADERRSASRTTVPDPCEALRRRTVK